MMPAMSIAAILGVADINDVCGYYHCSNGARVYYGNFPYRYCARLY
jgi:hypothetical protein